MSRKRHAFLAEDLTPEERKKAFIKEYPCYADHPFWDDDGMPSPDPKELENFVYGGYAFDEDAFNKLFNCCTHINDLIENITHILFDFGIRDFESYLHASIASFYPFKIPELRVLMKRITKIQVKLNDVNTEAIGLHNALRIIANNSDKIFTHEHVISLNIFLTIMQNNSRNIPIWESLAEILKYYKEPEGKYGLRAIRKYAAHCWRILHLINDAIYTICKAENLSGVVIKLPEQASEINIEAFHIICENMISD